MNVTRKKVRVVNETYSEYDLSGKPSELIRMIENMVLNVPIDFRDTVSIDFDAYDDYGCPSMSAEVSYTRLETLEELEDRTRELNKYRKQEIARLKILQEKYPDEV